jgi:flavin reductase (DIM6/NTAB) family NADH-FMN oxidoreductase RutF/rubredoxin
MDKKVMNQLSYGLFIVTANVNGKDNGCIINTAVQVASDPNRISIAVNKANHTHDMLMETGKFTISILSEEADFSLFQRFGFQSGRDTDKFAGFRDWKRVPNDTIAVTKGTNGYISGWIEQRIDLGSHTLFIAQVTDGEKFSAVPSATYTYYHQNIKPKPQAVGKTETGETVWRCTICGYEYVGEELPEDFICPLCKHPASDFEKVTKG